MLKRILALSVVFILLISGSALAAERQVAGLNGGERDRLDTFFSNFSEASLTEFGEEGAALDQLINFGIRHTIHNTKELESLDANHWGVPILTVRMAVQKYFGQDIPETEMRSTDQFELNSAGYYQVVKAGGEGFTFSQIHGFQPMPDGSYQALVSVYKAPSGFTGDTHAVWSNSQNPETPQRIAEYRAKMRKSPYEADRYILLMYKQERKVG